jgi:hypothetical protein
MKRIAAVGKTVPQEQYHGKYTNKFDFLIEGLAM